MRNCFGSAACITALLGAFPEPTYASWLEAFSIRSTFDAKMTARPATVLAQHVSGADWEYVVAAGGRYALGGARWETGPFVEWQRNTMETAKQNLVRVGANGWWQVRDVTKGDGPTNSPVVLGQFGYKDDAEARAQAGMATVNLTWFWKGRDRNPGRGWLPGGLAETQPIAWSYSPHVGLEFEHGDSGEKQFSVVRGVVALQVQAYPLPRLLDYDLHVTLDQTYRRGDEAETARRSREHSRLDLGVNYYFVRKSHDSDSARSAGVGWTYSRGRDPANSSDPSPRHVLALRLQF